MYKMTQVKTTIKEFYKRTPTNLWAQSINRVTNRQKKKKKEIGNFFTALYLFSTVLIGLFTNAEAAHNLRKCLFCLFLQSTGCTFKTQYGQKDMERHLKTHTGTLMLSKYVLQLQNPFRVRFNPSCFSVCHPGEKPFECELCHKRFSRRDKLNMHSRSHTGEKPHKCKHCPYAAADSSSLKKHLRIHYDERPFKCQICPYASRNSSQLTVHLRSHTGR